MSLAAGRISALPPLFATTAVVGFGHGLAFSGAMRQINAAEAAEAHGAVLATFSPSPTRASTCPPSSRGSPSRTAA